MSSEAHKINSKQCGTIVCVIGFYLEMGQNWSPWSEFCCLLYWFQWVQTTKMKLQKQCYDDNSMGFLSTVFLCSTLLCQTCFKYSLLQVAQDRARASIQKNTQTHMWTQSYSNTQHSQGHGRTHTHTLPSLSAKKNIESMLYETRERR